MSAALARIEAEYQAVRDTLPSQVLDAGRRRAAIETLRAEGLPINRTENWRYTNLRVLEGARFVPANAPADAATDLPAPLEGFHRCVFVDGVLHSSPATLAPGLAVRSLRASGNQKGLDTAPAASIPEARLALLNDAFATDAAEIEVAPEGGPQQLELLFIAATAAETGTSYPRVRVKLLPGAELTLVERHLSRGEAAQFINAAVRIDLAARASLTHCRLQRAGERAAWFDTLQATLSADARYHLLAVNSGALAARSTVFVRLAGAGAQAELSVASLGDRLQSQDTYALYEHLAERTRTEQTFRGIASGRARVAFNGKVVVRDGARGTDSRQSLRGLLAGSEAEIDVRPQLEIYTDDVRCSHGATAGKLDENMLFYLLSRGLAPEAAERLLKWAFIEDVISRIKIPALRRRIEQEVAGQMSDTVSLEELLE